MRVLTVVQRYNSISEPWLNRMIEGLGSDCVGVAGRTRADNGGEALTPPFRRLRTRNVLHRLLPKNLRRFSPLRPAAILTSYAKEIHADRILCHYGKIALEYEETWANLDLPLFVYFHGYDLMFDMRESGESGKRIHSEDYQERIVRLSDRAKFIANSEFSKSRLVEGGVKPDRIEVNYLGVESRPLKNLQKPPRPQILYVGRFVDCKRPDLTIRAFEILRDSGCDAQLTMVGDGAMRQECIRLRTESKYPEDINLPGTENHSSVQHRLRQATVFTMHSMRGPHTHQEEAFGVAFLDAMAYGLPVVTGNSGGVPEIVRHGKTGYLFEPGDVEAHARYLSALIKAPNLAEKMGRAGWEVAQAEFSQEKSTEGLRGLLHAV